MPGNRPLRKFLYQRTRPDWGWRIQMWRLSWYRGRDERGPL